MSFDTSNQYNLLLLGQVLILINYRLLLFRVVITYGFGPGLLILHFTFYMLIPNLSQIYFCIPEIFKTNV